MMLNKNNAWVITILFLFGIMVSTFNHNHFKTVGNKWFEEHQKDSEALVIGRIHNADVNGISSNALFMQGNEEAIKTKYSFYKYKSWNNNDVYTSSSGLQGTFYVLLDQILPNSKDIKIKLYYLLSSILLSLVLITFIIYTKTEFGIIAALSLFFGIILSDWLVVFARNLYWSIWLMYLPTLISLLYLNQSKFVRSKKRLYFLIYLTIFIKSLCGYEYLSTIFISMTIPFIYKGIAYSQIKENIIEIIKIGFYGGMAFISALVIHGLQLSLLYSDATKAFNNITAIVLKRTHGNPDNVDPIYTKSLESDVLEVISIYVNGFYHDFYNVLTGYFRLDFITLSAFFLISSLALISVTKINNKQIIFKKSYALVFCLLISTLAPLSWFILAKGHSYIHTTMNHLLWNIPFNLIGFIIIGYTISQLTTNTFYKLRKLQFVKSILK